ncbi:DUF6197 family protein [Pseudonocardia endophytica]|uniref:Uncharacterized protein n=1 Tax=Pseudonocardia endophytica TaxID=401976 RepID=A0A4R1HSM8_PSEEN|nr:hypothetical protein [Pseudonocardia endophytica]TCK22859.1 hypothetical protein EV378_6870 [Pseudonocardia endophytica]
MAYTTIPTSDPFVPSPVVPAPATTPSEEERTLAILEAARAILERGWLQDGWYRTGPRPLRQRLFGPTPGPDGIDSACLVAAVAVAGHGGGAFTHIDRDSGPAVDRVWESLQEMKRGHHDAPEGAVAPIVRRARMRELVRWNDTPGRTRSEVLGVMDRAISRTILAQMR